MILAIDPGFANCGWAVVRPRLGRVVALGVITTERDPSVDKSTDRARRVTRVTREIARIATEHSITAIAAEQMLGFGPAAAVAANLLPWGALVGLAVMLNVELHEVQAKQWQRAVLPGSGKKVNYTVLERSLGAFASGQAGAAFAVIDRGLRTHAIDAIGVGLFVALTRGANRIATAEARA